MKERAEKREVGESTNAWDVREHIRGAKATSQTRKGRLKLLHGA